MREWAAAGREVTALARNLPPLPAGDAYTTALQVLAERSMDGFLYHGDRLDTITTVVKVLRADPDLARRLLGDPSPEGGPR